MDPTNGMGFGSRPQAKPKMRLNVEARDDRIKLGDLRDAIRADPKGMARKFDALIAQGARWKHVPDLTAMFHGLKDLTVSANVNLLGEPCAVNVGAFPLLCGGLSVAQINDAAQAVPTIGDQLVTEMDDTAEVTTIAGILVHGPASGVRKTDTEQFPEIGASEERFDILDREQGYLVNITARTLELGAKADFENRLNALGEFMMEDVEEQTLARVTDDQGSKSSPAEPYVLRLNKSGTALYSSTANTPGTRAPSGTRITNNALVDRTDLEAVRVRLATMRNGRGKRIAIPWSECQVLIPDALSATMDTLVSSEMSPGVENEINPFGPRGRWRLRPDQIFSSPKVDDLSTSAWYAGNFRKQFRRKWALRMELVTLGGDTESFLKTRLAFQARIAWNCEIGAVDYNYVVQCLAGTTAPGDE